MGKQARPYPQGKLRLKVDGKKDNEKLYPIYIEYSFHSVVRRKGVGISAKIADWNPKGRGELRASYGAQYKQTNTVLLRKLAETDAKMREFVEKHPNQINLNVIKDILEGKQLTRKDEGKDFVQFVIGTLEDKYNNHKIGVSRKANGLSCMNQFQEYLVTNKKGTYKPDSIYLGELKPETIQGFIDWKRDIKKNKHDTIQQCLAPIICALEYASDMGYIEKSVYAHVKNMRATKDDTIDDAATESFDGKYLTKEQLEKLIKFYENDKEPRRKEFIEIFLFSFHCCGLRASDVISLQWAHVDFNKKVINKMMVKTKTRIQVPLTDSSIKILKKWKGLGRRERYVFDLVSDDLDLNNREAFYNARISAEKCLNQSLKVVGERIGLPFNLTMHKARHTFACLALDGGMSMTVVGRLLGHADTSVTERVYAMFMPTKLEEEVGKLNFDFLPNAIQ